MKITFEGQGFNDILDQMAALLERSGIKIATETYAHAKTATAQPAQGLTSEAIFAAKEAAVNKPVDKPVQKRERTEKQKANDERLRVAAQAKLEAKRAAKAAKNAPPSYPTPPPPASAESLGLAPDEVVRVRQKTIEDLQSAYANGFQKEVFELLSRFGNGAKSFRELPPESFVPIREAIDLGALTDKAPT